MGKNGIIVRRGCCLAWLLASHVSQSHHSSLGLYDVDRIIEIEGVVTSVVWRNPHPSYTVTVPDETGETVEWNVEIGGATTTLRLRGVTRDVVHVGDRVRIAGEPSTRGRAEMFAHNLLLENGQEVLLGIRAEPRWPAGLRGDFFRSVPNEATTQGARLAADGIFRVWSADLNDATSFSLYREDGYPLTESANDLKAQWDPRASPYLGCQPRGMPYLMNNPYPIEFMRREDGILLRMEMYDAQRLIHMNTEGTPSSAPYSLFGYSTGRWEGSTLIVETDRIDAPYFDGGDGTPQGRVIRLVERFNLNEKDDRLDYRLTVSDPATFTKEIEFARYWSWRPEIRVEPFGCQD